MRKSAGGKSVRKSTRKAIRKNNTKETTTKTYSSENNIKNEYKEASSRKPPDKIKFYSIKDKLPPDKPINILYYDPLFGYQINLSAIVLQHIHHDISTLGFSRTTHWASLKTKKE